MKPEVDNGFVVFTTPANVKTPQTIPMTDAEWDRMVADTATRRSEAARFSVYASDIAAVSEFADGRTAVRLTNGHVVTVAESYDDVVKAVYEAKEDAQ